MSEEAITAAAPDKAKMPDPVVRRSQRPVIRIVRPKAAVLMKRPESAGSMPNGAKNAMSMEKKGGHPTIGLPKMFRKPSPAARFSAPAMYMPES